MTTEGMASGDRGGPVHKRGPLFTVFFVVVAILIVVGGILLFQRRVQYQALANETEAAAIPAPQVAVHQRAVDDSSAATTHGLVVPAFWWTRHAQAGKAATKTWCCGGRCRHMWSARFMRAPTGI